MVVEHKRMGNTYKTCTQSRMQQLLRGDINRDRTSGFTLRTFKAVSETQMETEEENSNWLNAILQGLQPNLQGIAESACKDFSQSLYSDGFTNTPSGQVIILTKTDRPETGVRSPQTTRYRGQSNTDHKPARTALRAILQESDSRLLQGWLS